MEKNFCDWKNIQYFNHHMLYVCFLGKIWYKLFIQYYKILEEKVKIKMYLQDTKLWLYVL